MHRVVAKDRTHPFRASLLGIPVIALGVAFVLGMALLLAQTSLVASTGYNVERLEELKATRQRQIQRLEAEVASLRSLERIEWEARTRLRMVSPASYLYLTVDTFPQDPTPLLKKALKENAVSSRDKARPWWENLPFVLFLLRRES